ncbi:hypothetical protein FXF51_05670 [Nonomuraea sp. PA05]|uniref:hypothetical protein n=1 Tax=Nonomuraea sp. PA05 TaxID=2604466 RepID=UPI0011DAA828|nr:hypothetical protein [Nonomuraea sp. PA05]TYB69648.1 hypothetical protein FXF51_05670 [Nonomuraea sp. PA05]
MTTVYDPFGLAEFAVEIRDGETLIGRTEPSRNADDAKQAFRKLNFSYPDSRIVWRRDPLDEWDAITDDAINRIAYQRTATILMSLIGEGLANVNWSLSATHPNQVDGHLVREDDPREALKRYAVLLGCEVTERPHLHGKVQIAVEGTYCGLTVKVWDLVDPVADESGDEPAEVAS